MVSDQDFADLKESHDRLKHTMDVLLVNLLQPALDVPGTLRFGGNAMQLGDHGMQVESGNGTAETALWFVDGLSSNPALLTTASYIAGEISDSGSAPNIYMYSFNPAAHAFWATRVYSNDTAGIEAQVVADEFGALYWTIPQGTAETANLDLHNTFLTLRELTTEPFIPISGGIWYYNDSFVGYRNGVKKNFLMTGDVSGAMKVSGSGYLVYPAAAAGIDPANSGSAWTNGAWSEVIASTSEADYIVGLSWAEEADVNTVEYEIDIGTGAGGAETKVSTIAGSRLDGSSYINHTIMLPHAIAVAASTRIAVRVRSSDTAREPDNIKLIYVKQSELVSL